MKRKFYKISAIISNDFEESHSETESIKNCFRLNKLFDFASWNSSFRSATN